MLKYLNRLCVYNNKHVTNLLLFTVTRNIGDLFLDVFDCITHAGRQRATLIQKTEKKQKKQESFHVLNQTFSSSVKNH